VSMNLADYRLTPPAAAFAAVEREAAARGARVVERELVGLVPEAALAGDDPDARALTALWADRVLERRLGRPEG